MPQTIDRPRRKDLGVPNDGGRFIAVPNPEGPAALTQADRPDLEVASDAEATPSQLRALSWSKRTTVRDAVSANPNTPEDVLTRYLDIGLGPRRAILMNPALGEETLRGMITRPDRMHGSSDLQAIAARPDLSRDLIEPILRRRHLIADTVLAGRRDLDLGVAERMLPEAGRQVAQTLAQNSALPQNLRTRAALRAEQLLAAIRAADPEVA